MFKRLVLIICMWVFVGCTAGTGNTVQHTPTTAATPQGTSAATSNPTTITLWHSWTGRAQQALHGLARNFEQANPDIRIALVMRPVASLVRDYQAQLAAGSAPQLLLLRGRYIRELATRQQVMPLETAFGEQELATLLPAAVETGRIDGQLFGLPLSVDTLVWWYDRRALPTPPAHLEALLAGADPAQAGAETEQPIKLAYHLSMATTLPYLYALDGQITTTNDPLAFAATSHTATIRWLSQLQRIAADPTIRASADLHTVDSAFQTRRAISVIDWSFRISEYEAVWGAEAVGVAPLPPLAADTKAPPTVVLPYAVCASTGLQGVEQQAALAFLRYLTSEPAQTMLAQQGNLLPANTQASLEGPLAQLRQAYTNAAPMPPTLDSRSWTALDEMIRSVLAGDYSPEQAVEIAATHFPASAGRP